MKNKQKINLKNALKICIDVHDDISEIVTGDRLEQIEIDKTDYVVLDLETDLCGKYGQIIQVVAAKISKGKVVDKFNSYIYPGYELSPEIENNTKCSNSFFDKKIDRKETFVNLRDFIGEAVIVACSYEYWAYIRELNKFSIKSNSPAWINASYAVSKIKLEDKATPVAYMFDELSDDKHSVGYLLDIYADLCITIIEIFTAKQLYDLRLINEYYQKMDRYSGVHYYNYDMYVIVDNIDSIEYLLSFAKEKKYDFNDEYNYCLDVKASELDDMSKHLSFAIIGGENRYFERTLLFGVTDIFAKKIIDNASLVSINVIEEVVDKAFSGMKGLIDENTLRDVYHRELEELMNRGNTTIPAKQFKEIKRVSLYELNKFYKIFK